MDPLIWGPVTWNWMLHLAESEEKKNFLQIAKSLTKCIPCAHCRRSYSMYHRELDPSKFITDSQTAMQWVWTIHDMVNQKLGKYCIAYSIIKARRFHHSIQFETIDVLSYILYSQFERRDESVLTALQEILFCLNIPLSSNENDSFRKIECAIFDMHSKYNHLDEIESFRNRYLQAVVTDTSKKKRVVTRLK